jgi:hypothetical protein
MERVSRKYEFMRLRHKRAGKLLGTALGGRWEILQAARLHEIIFDLLEETLFRR